MTDKQIETETERTETIHLRLNDAELGELDQIVAWMKKDPVIGRLKAKLGREKAIRYAIGRLLANPPEHVAG